MGSYGETMRQATVPTAFHPLQQSGATPTPTCDQCVAPSVAVVTLGEGESALSLEFCRHHLAEHTDKLAEGGHQVRFHS